jgi:hypothetical protein
MDLKTLSCKNRERFESPHGFNRKLMDVRLSDLMAASLTGMTRAVEVLAEFDREGRECPPANGDGEAHLRARLAWELASTFLDLDLLLQRLGLDTERVVRQAFNTKSDEIGCRIKL